MFQRCVFLLSFFFVFAVEGGNPSNGKYVPITGDVAKESGGKSKFPTGSDSKACQKDEDCALVNPGCCSCSSGGESVAIHKDLVKSYNSKARKKCNASVVQSFCSTVYLCGKFQAKCKNSKCVKVKCSAGQQKVCEVQAKESDHNILTIDPGSFKPIK